MCVCVYPYTISIFVTFSFGYTGYLHPLQLASHHVMWQKK